jgi:hypothetical protein
MNYEEMWDELKERLEKAELEMLKLHNKEGINSEERIRLLTKLQGLRIALEYMREMTK